MLVLSGENSSVTGESSITVQGNSYYFDSWESPIDSDEDGATLLGDAWGSLLIESSYLDRADFTLQQIESPSDGDGNGDGDGDGETPSDEAPTHHWVFVGGSFDDLSQVVETGGYLASGSYQTTAGTAADRHAETRQLDSPISGSIAISGNHHSSITLDASGTLTADEILWETGSLHIYESSDSLSTINASGTIAAGGLTGTIAYYDHQQTDFLRDLTFDLTSPTLPAIGHGHDLVLSDTRYDQLASGTIQWDDMSGTQWAEIKEHAFLSISVDYIWLDGELLTDQEGSEGDGGGDPEGDGEGNSLGGWQTTTADLVLTVDSSFDIGYDVGNYVTRDGLSGTSEEQAFQRGVDFTSLSIAVTPEAAQTQTHLRTMPRCHRVYHDLLAGDHSLSSTNSEASGPATRSPRLTS